MSVIPHQLHENFCTGEMDISNENTNIQLQIEIRNPHKLAMYKNFKVNLSLE